MGNNEIGEHSRKSSCKNGDADRPFKKAKYAWQLKGKYHLKGNNKQARSHIKNSSEASEKEANNIAFINKNNNNVGSSGSSCNKCCLDTLLARSNALLEIEDFSDQESDISNADVSALDDVPVSLTKTNPRDYDDMLHKWQARQVAKCFFDNTINTILEQWKISPVDASDIVENCDSGGKVEDEGILMAIQSHGLYSGTHQITTSTSYKLSPYVDVSTLDNFENTQQEIEKQTSSTQSKTCKLDVDRAIYDDNPNLKMDDPMDFMSAAVSVAIQKKGLSSYNYR